MVSLILIGLVGGLITGISPCILPVLPVIFLSGGVQGGRVNDDEQVNPDRRRPFLVIAGLVLSFSVFTLLGSLLLELLSLPADLLRWAGLAVLVAIGIGLIVPRFQHLLEKPFSRIPQRAVGTSGGGFVLGLALGAVYVPCAGPVLAAITVAGATGEIGVSTVVLTATFAIGAAIPLLVFALAGRRVAERVRAFRAHQKRLRVAAGIVMIALAIGVTFNVPAALQRLIPDYTSALQEAAGGSRVVQDQLSPAAADSDWDATCAERAPTPVDCGPAPAIEGISSWLNTPGGKPIELADLKGEVALVNFWSYSCINCQRESPHLNAWSDNYADSGLTVIGVHSPEYAFEQNEDNVIAGAARAGITYPIALDNDFVTWQNYDNAYWPANYIIDAEGVIRHISFGEGGYDTLESQIRELLVDADPDVTLPEPTEVLDKSPTSATLTPESVFGAFRQFNYRGDIRYEVGTAEYRLPAEQDENTYSLDGEWTVGEEGITARGDARIRLDYSAQHVYLNVEGSGTLAVTRGGRTTTIPVVGEPNLYAVVDAAKESRGEVTVELSPGLTAYSFTFG